MTLKARIICFLLYVCGCFVVWYSWHYPKERYLDSFTLKDIIDGLVLNNSKDDFLVNSILMMGKSYIHKSRYLKVKPAFCAFHNEFVLYTKAKVMKGKNAINLFSIIEYIYKKYPIPFNVLCIFICLSLFPLFLLYLYAPVLCIVMWRCFDIAKLFVH